MRPGNLLFVGSQDMKNSYGPESAYFPLDFDEFLCDSGSRAAILGYRPDGETCRKNIFQKREIPLGIVREKVWQDEIDKKITNFAKNSWNICDYLV